MKTLFKILFIGLLTVLLSYAATAGATGNDPVAKDKNLFVLKADKKFVGAKVTILQSNGTVVAEQILERRKMIIDFDSMKTGAYTIVLSKGGQTKEMKFTRR
jgi:hypothetical protein